MCNMHKNPVLGEDMAMNKSAVGAVNLGLFANHIPIKIQPMAVDSVIMDIV